MTKSNISVAQILWVWIFPILALAATGTLFYKYWTQRGPLVEIQFTDAAGMEPDKTVLRYKGVNVGKVEQINLDKNGTGILVLARLTHEAESLAVKGSQFSIVQPKVDFQGVRGLETLFRGSYIRVTEGTGERTLKFIGHTEDEESEKSEHAVTYQLYSSSLEAISTGDPVYYRGARIGSVLSVDLANSGQEVQTQIQIEKKYSKFIRNNTNFWLKSGIEAKLGLFGSQVKVGSLESLLKGGIALATPTEAEKMAPAGQRFELKTNAPKDFEKWNPKF